MSGYGNTFVDERKKNRDMRKTNDRNRINCHWMTRFFRAEGFLQSLKFSNPVMQEYVCLLVGKKAKFKGKKKKWFRDQTLYWRGNPIKRDSKEYQDLLDRAFEALATNKKFQKTLLDTQNATLTHAMGKKKSSETVLTTQEFCSRLTKIREQLKKKG